VAAAAADAVVTKATAWRGGTTNVASSRHHPFWRQRMDAAFLKNKISTAKSELGVAEKEMQIAITALKQGTRADKTIVTEAIESAFAKLRNARVQLAEAEEAIEK
jgi:hypothetical protein